MIMKKNNVSGSDDRVILTIDEDQSIDAKTAQIPSSPGVGSLGRNNSYFFDDDIDPPTKLIGSFLKHQKESGNFLLDPNVEELTFSPNNDSKRSRESEPRSRRRTSFEKPYSRACSNKSRLLDQPQPQLHQKSGNIFKSGILKQDSPAQAAEDDPLDIPDNHPSRKPHNAWVLLEWALLVLSIGALICTTNIPVLEQRTFLGLHSWRWAVLGFVILSGRLLSGWIIRLIVFFIERNFILRKRLVYFVYGLQKGVQNCLWFGIVLLAWRLIFDPNLPLPIRRERDALQIVTKVLICFLVAASLWLIKILLVKVLALNFHVSTYFDRIQESLFNQYILEALSGPPLLDDHHDSDPNAGPENADLRRSQVLKRSGQIGATGISIERLQRMNQKNVSAWNMKRLIRLAKSSRITTLLESGEEDLASDTNNSEIDSEWQAKSAAKHIFKNVVGKKTDCRSLTLTDLMRFLGDEEASMKAFALFDGAMECGEITKHALVSWVVNVYRERRALSFSLNDTKTAVNKLHTIIDAIMLIIISVISLLILGIATTHLLVALSSQLVLVVFVFGNTCRTVFEAIVFLFAMHPFDVGDRCVVDGIQMVVEEMNILTTVFLRYDNEKIYYPNSVLATKPISNFYRSPDMGDAIDFSIHISTSSEKIEALKAKIKKYIDSHLHHWYPKHDLVMKEIEDMNRIRMALWLQHTMNHQNAGEKWIRRSHLLFHLKDSFQELDIDYRLLPQEVRLLS